MLVKTDPVKPAFDPNRKLEFAEIKPQRFRLRGTSTGRGIMEVSSTGIPDEKWGEALKNAAERTVPTEPRRTAHPLNGSRLQSVT